MAQSFRTAFAGGDDSAVIQRRSAEARELTKIANRPSKRQRMLESSRAPKLMPDDIYRGEDLKRRPR